MAITIIVTACSNEEEPVYVQDDSVSVGVSILVENKLTSRAISDATGVDKLVYAVYDADGNAVVNKTELSELSGVKDGYELSFPLLFNKTYTAVFWAQNSECEAYTISEDMKVTIDYDGLNNDETRDAFFATETFTVNSLSFEKEVVLKRPFAQVNVGSYKYEVEMAERLGFDVSKSSATIKGVANVLDLKTGDIEGSEDVEYGTTTLPTANTNPKEYLMVDIDNDGKKDEFEYLSMSYVLAGQRSTHEMSFTFYDDEDNEITFDTGLAEVPIERNWRTNIVGQILSEEPIKPESSFTIKIDPSYEDENNFNNGFIYAYEQGEVIENEQFIFDDLYSFAYLGAKKNTGTELKFKNVSFAGKVGSVTFGIYDEEKGSSVAGKYSLENVNITDLTINSNWGVTNNGQIICMGAAVYGECVLKNCVMTGLKIDGPKNSDGKYINQNGLVVNDYFDLVVVNNISATIDGGEYGKMYTYEHAKTTIKGDVKIANLTTRTLSVSGGKLVIEGGTIEKITVIPVGKYVPTIVVGPGATVKEIDFGGAKATGFTNNSGKEITIKNVAE